jgi:hypothetical protein
VEAYPVSWIFPPTSVLATRAHVYKTESLVPRLALVFAIGAACGVLYDGTGDGSSSAPSRRAEVSRAHAAAPAPAAVKRTAHAAPLARPAEETVGAATKRSEPATKSAEPAAKPAQMAAVPPGPTKPVEPEAKPAASAPKIATRASRSVRDAKPADTESSTASALEPIAAGSDDDAAEADAPRARRAQPSRQAARTPSSRHPDPPGLRYVGTRLLPDGSRIPVYRRERDVTRRIIDDDDDRPVRRYYSRAPFDDWD